MTWKDITYKQYKQILQITDTKDLSKSIKDLSVLLFNKTPKNIYEENDVLTKLSFLQTQPAHSSNKIKINNSNYEYINLFSLNVEQFTSLDSIDYNDINNQLSYIIAIIIKKNPYKRDELIALLEEVDMYSIFGFVSFFLSNLNLLKTRFLRCSEVQMKLKKQKVETMKYLIKCLQENGDGLKFSTKLQMMTLPNYKELRNKKLLTF